MKSYIGTRGFTLVELLVVIAIIGTLSSIVLASLSTARTKAFDVKVKAQLLNIRTAAGVYQATNGDYGAPFTWTGTSTGCSGGMFTDTASNLSQLSISGNYPVGENTIICNSTRTAYAVSDNLAASGTYWCVDSTGTSKLENISSTTALVCP